MTTRQRFSGLRWFALMGFAWVVAAIIAFSCGCASKGVAGSSGGFLGIGGDIQPAPDFSGVIHTVLILSCLLIGGLVGLTVTQYGGNIVIGVVVGSIAAVATAAFLGAVAAFVLKIAVPLVIVGSGILAYWIYEHRSVKVALGRRKPAVAADSVAGVSGKKQEGT